MTILEDSQVLISERGTMISSVADRYITPEYLAPLPTNVRIYLFYKSHVYMSTFQNFESLTWMDCGRGQATFAIPMQ